MEEASDSGSPYSPSEKSVGSPSSRQHEESVSGMINLDAYINLLNRVIRDVIQKNDGYDASPLAASQVGCTVWSGREKESLYYALDHKGRDDVQALSNAIKTKSPPEIRAYLTLLQDELLKRNQDWEHHPSLLDYPDLPAALEIGPECEAVLDHAADLVAEQQFRQELEEAEDSYGDWSIINRQAVFLEKQGLILDEKRIETMPEQLQSAIRLIKVETLVDLSDQIFMNPNCIGEIREKHAKDQITPSITTMAILDFHTLVLHLIKRLVLSAILCAKVRISRKRYYRKVRRLAKEEDVRIALDHAGMKRCDPDYWPNLARKYSLKVYDEVPRKHHPGFRYSYSEVEQLLKSANWDQPPSAAAEAPDNFYNDPGRHESHDQEIVMDDDWVSCSGTSASTNDDQPSSTVEVAANIAHSEPSRHENHDQEIVTDDDSASSDTSASTTSNQTPIAEEAADTTSDEPSGCESHDQEIVTDDDLAFFSDTSVTTNNASHTVYANALDVRASGDEEARLLEVLYDKRSPPIKKEEQEIPAAPERKRKAKEDLVDWRDWIAYKPEWKRQKKTFRGKDFAANRQKRKRTRSPRSLLSNSGDDDLPDSQDAAAIQSNQPTVQLTDSDSEVYWTVESSVSESQHSFARTDSNDDGSGDRISTSTLQSFEEGDSWNSQEATAFPETLPPDRFTDSDSESEDSDTTTESLAFEHQRSSASLDSRYAGSAGSGSTGTHETVSSQSGSGISEADDESQELSFGEMLAAMSNLERNSSLRRFVGDDAIRLE